MGGSSEPATGKEQKRESLISKGGTYELQQTRNGISKSRQKQGKLDYLEGVFIAKNEKR